MTITLRPEAEQELRVEAERRKLTPEQVGMQAMLAGLRTRRVPRTLANLAPPAIRGDDRTLDAARRELGPWPGEETEEELLTALTTLG